MAYKKLSKIVFPFFFFCLGRKGINAKMEIRAEEKLSGKDSEFLLRVANLLTFSFFFVSMTSSFK